MNRTLAIPTALSILAAALIGQGGSVVMPAAAATANLGTSASIWRAGLNHVQCIYDASNFAAQGLGFPVVISSVRFRLAGGASTNIVTYPLVEVYLQSAAVDHLAMSTTFAENRTAPLGVPHYSGPVTTQPVAGTSPNGYFVTIPVTPFVYCPDAGLDLLLEFIIRSAPTPAVANTASTASNAALHGCNSVRSVGSAVALAGATSAFVPVVEFGIVPAPNLAWYTRYGKGSHEGIVSYYEQFPRNTVDLSNHTVTMFSNVLRGYTVVTTPGSTIVPPTGPGLALGNDSLSPPIALPFNFTFPGGSTSSIRIDANGSIILGGVASSSRGGSAAAILALPSRRLCPLVQDLVPDGATNVRNVFHNIDPADPNTYLITWSNVPCAGGTNGSTFQVALINNGTNLTGADDTVEYRYGTVANDSTTEEGAAVTGFSKGSGAKDPGNTDLTSGPTTTEEEQDPVTLEPTGGIGTTLNRPIVNSTVTFPTSHIPPSALASMLFVSGGQVVSGFDLGFAGAPGVRLYVTLPEIASFLQFGSPTATTQTQIPSSGSLIGLTVFLQVAVFDTSANAFGVLASNGIAVRMGNN